MARYVESAARNSAAALRASNGAAMRVRQVKILGPAPAPIERLRGRYRWQILLKGRSAGDLRRLVRPVFEEADRRGRTAGVRVAIDVDPYGML